MFYWLNKDKIYHGIKVHAISQHKPYHGHYFYYLIEINW